MFFIKGKNCGFTLIEAVLVVALVGLIASFSVPVYMLSKKQNDLFVAQTTLVSMLRRAQILALTQSNDSPWGVKVIPHSFIVFSGSNFVSRDNSYDEVYDFSESVETAGSAEIVFAKLTGVPNQIGAIDLHLDNGMTKQVTINAKGTIDF